MNTQIAEKLKTVLQGEPRDLVDPYVEITFCDQKVGFMTLYSTCLSSPNSGTPISHQRLNTFFLIVNRLLPVFHQI